MPPCTAFRGEAPKCVERSESRGPEARRRLRQKQLEAALRGFRRQVAPRGAAFRGKALEVRRAERKPRAGGPPATEAENEAE